MPLDAPSSKATISLDIENKEALSEQELEKLVDSAFDESKRKLLSDLQNDGSLFAHHKVSVVSTFEKSDPA